MKRCKSDDEKSRMGYFVRIYFDPQHKESSPKPILEVFDKKANHIKTYNACVGYGKGCDTGVKDRHTTPCGEYEIQSIDVKSGKEKHKYQRPDQNNGQPMNVTGIYGKGRVFCRLKGKGRNSGINGRGIGIHGWPKERWPWVYDSEGCIRIKEIHDFVNNYAYPTMKVILIPYNN